MMARHKSEKRLAPEGQCPYDGGNAVYDARVLLMYITHEILDYSNACNSGSRFANMENRLNGFIKISPNPSNGKFRLEWKMFDAVSHQFDIVSTNGAKLFEGSLFGEEGFKQIDLSELPSGIYLFKIYEDPEIKQVQKIIILK